MDIRQTNPGIMILVEAYLDLYGLEPYTFRLLAHIARRGQKNDCVSALEKMATVCKMGTRKAQDALDELYRLDIVKKQSRYHQPSACQVIHDIREWAKPKDNWDVRTDLQKEQQDSFAHWKERQELTRMGMEETPSKVIFIHGYLDLYGLDPYAFRILAHIARRGTCVDSIGKIATVCKMSDKKVQTTLKYLCKQRLVYKPDKTGNNSKPTWYRVAPVSDWKEPSNNWENQRYLTRLKNYEIKYKAEPEKYKSMLDCHEAKLEKYTTELSKELEKVKASMLSSGILAESMKGEKNNREHLSDTVAL